MTQNSIPEPLIRFQESASAFCQWVEHEPGDAEAEATTAIRLLCSLLHFIQYVPSAEPEDLPENEPLRKGENTLSVYKRFSVLPFNYYSEVWNPLEVPGAEPVTGDLADDLRDIYLDIKEGLMFFEQGHPRQAAFHWTFLFGVHWGEHATSAVRALYCYLNDPSRPE